MKPPTCPILTTATGVAPGEGAVDGSDVDGAGDDVVDGVDAAGVADADGAADAEGGAEVAAGVALQATISRSPNNARVGRAGDLVMGVQTHGTPFGSARSGAAGGGLVRAAATRESDQVLVQLEPDAVIAVDAR